jgi:hypothetical protein
MSTKTTFKRIALVAVAALGFGMLSVAPSSAAPGTATAIAIANTTTTAGTALAASKYTSAPVLDELAISAFSVTAGSAVVLHLTAIGGDGLNDDNQTRVALRGYGYVVAAHANATTAAGAEDPLTSFNAPTVVGTYTLDVETTTADPAAFDSNVLKYSVTMTVTAPTGVSATLSTAHIKAGNTETIANATTDLVTASGTSTAGTANSGSIALTMKNTLGAAMSTGNTITAQITAGPGYLVALTADTPTDDQCSTTPTYSATVGRAISAFDPGAIANIIICADGTVGVATIALSVTNQSVTTAWATKSFTFYGPVRTLAVATSNFTIGAAGGDETGASVAARTEAGEVTNAGALTTNTTTPAFIISAKDAAGQLATAASAPTVISSAPTVVASGSCTLDDGSSATYSSGQGFGLYNCSFTTAASAKSGDKATLTFRINDPLGTAGIDYLTTTVDVTVGGTRFTETLALNKATYTEGEALVVTRTAKDSSGNPVADGSAAPAVVFNKAVGGTAPGAGFYVGGTLATSSSRPAVFAPTASGVFEARMSGRNGSTTTVAIITTATVAESAAEAAANAAGDAAAEATDAANAATDAANAAAEAADAATAAAQDAADAVAALSTSVTAMVDALRKQITSLTNLVIKIQKKVRA